MEMNDGGNFSPDEYIRMLARLQGGSISTKDMDNADRLKQDAINSAMGTAGTIRNVGGVAAKLIPSEFDLAANAYKRAPDLVPAAENAVQEGSAGLKKLIPQEIYENPDLGKNAAEEGEDAVREITKRNFSQIQNLLNGQ